MEPKPGWKATEFWLSLVGGIGALAVPLQLASEWLEKAKDIFPGSTLLSLAAVSVAGVLAMAKVFAAYTAGRSELKRSTVLRTGALVDYAVARQLPPVFESLANTAPPPKPEVRFETGGILGQDMGPMAVAGGYPDGRPR